MLRKLLKYKPHQEYFLRDGRGPLPGASTICKIGEDMGGLIHWAYLQGKEGKDYRTERDAAADSGTVAHALAEAYLVGDELDLTEFTEEAVELGTKAFEKFKEWYLGEGMTFLNAELQLVSHNYEFGGTLDLLCRDPAKKKCLIDLKATKALRTSHGIQVAGYITLENENSEEPVDRACILRLPKDGSDVEPMWIPPENFAYYQRAFLANLDSFYARMALNKVDPIALKAKKWRKKK